jgi:hypothetical protein
VGYDISPLKRVKLKILYKYILLLRDICEKILVERRVKIPPSF